MRISIHPLALALAGTLAGTGEGAMRVVATTSDLAWFAAEVGGDRVTVSSIARGYQDPHYVEPKPSYIVALSRARLLLYVGLELEVGWLPRLLDGAGNPAIREGATGLWTPATEVRLLERPLGTVDRSSGDIHPFGNPHYWLAPDNARLIARGLGEKLAALDPEGAAAYRARAVALAGRIERKDAEWKERLRPLAGTRLVTHHRTLSYFMEHFGLVVIDYIEPKPGVPPSAAHLAQLIERVKSEGVKLLLVESFFDPRDARFVAEKTGLPVEIVAVSVGALPGTADWFAVLERLVEAVEKAGAGRP